MNHILTLEAFPPFAEDMLERAFSVHRIWQAADRDSNFNAIRDSVRGIAAFGHNTIDATLLDRLPKVEIVSLMSVGYDRVDLPALRERRVVLTNTPDVLTNDVADLAIALIVAASRQIVAGDSHVRGGKWTRSSLPLAQSITGKTLGILGLGRIGSAIARRAEALQMNVAYWGRSEKPDVPWPYFDDPVALADACDVLVIAVPGGSATRHLVDRRVIDALGPNGTLVNVARGSVVDEEALVAALRSGRLGGAALDVFENEPHVPKELLEMAHVILQPHVGSATHQTRMKMAQLMIDNLLRHFAGEALLTQVP